MARNLLVAIILSLTALGGAQAVISASPTTNAVSGKSDLIASANIAYVRALKTETLHLQKCSLEDCSDTPQG